MPGDLILGYDDTPSARAALDVAIEQAKRFGERLVILFAYAPPGRSVGDEFKEHRPRKIKWEAWRLSSTAPLLPGRL